MMSDDDYVRGGTQKDYYNSEDVENCNCPVCDEDNSRHICNERGSIGIVKCNSCCLIYVNPRVKNSTNNYHGKSEIYVEEARLIFNDSKRHHRDVNYEYELKKILTNLRDVSVIRLNASIFKRVQIYQNNSFYSFLEVISSVCLASSSDFSILSAIGFLVALFFGLTIVP